MTPSRPRLTEVDQLRGIAALAVTWFHLTNQYPEASWVRQSGFHGWLGVEVFFVISGFVLPWALFGSGYSVQRDFGRFMARRLIRLEPPYLVSIVLVILLWYASAAMPGFAGKPPDLSAVQVASHLGYLTGLLGEAWLSPVYWTLAIEFQFYLLLAMTLPIWLHPRPLVPLIASAMICALGAVVSDKLLPHYWAYFAMGIAVFRARVGLDSSAQLLAACTLMAAILVALGRMPLAAAVGLGAVLVLSVPRHIPSVALLRWLGAISFSLYLVHVPIGGRVVNLMSRLGDSTTIQFVASLMALALSLLAAQVFWWLIERPSMRWAASLPLVRRDAASHTPAVGSTR
ncbi:MAG: acyltransferase [Rubrivivax sp.]|nr:acyltransferase [Rubrivivax sp.]